MLYTVKYMDNHIKTDAIDNFVITIMYLPKGNDIISRNKYAFTMAVIKDKTIDMTIVTVGSAPNFKAT